MYISTTLYNEAGMFSTHRDRWWLLISIRNLQCLHIKTIVLTIILWNWNRRSNKVQYKLPENEVGF